MPRITIEERFIRDLYMDPVMAAAVILGETRLDAFQRAMLRYMWFCPVSMDSSGQGSGKTLMMFIYLNLRAVLIPDQWVIYVPPTLDQGERMFWNKYYESHYLKPGVAPLFTGQLRKVRGSQFGTVNREGFKMRKFRNGSQIMMIPPNISKEGASAAGEDCNTIAIEENSFGGHTSLNSLSTNVPNNDGSSKTGKINPKTAPKKWASWATLSFSLLLI